MHLRLTGAVIAALCLTAGYAAYCVSPWLGGAAAGALAIAGILYGPVCSLKFWGQIPVREVR